MTPKTLPTYQAMVSAVLTSDLVVDCVAVVDSPAIEKVFLAFKPETDRMIFTKVNAEERIVVGPAMIPDLLIYRNNKLGEHNVYFTKETVQTIAEKFYALNLHQNANEMHDSAKMIDGFNFFMSFIRNTDKGMIGLEGEYPEGTWFLGAKVTDDAVWKKIQDGEYKGFSVEGLFQYKLEQPKVEKISEDEMALELEQLMVKDDDASFARIIEIMEVLNRTEL